MFFFWEVKKINSIEKNKYWIWFSLIDNLGVRRKLKLLEIYKNPQVIYNLSKKDLLSNKGIGEKICKIIIESKNESLINEQMKKMKENGVGIINIFDEEYPGQLKQIYDPPISIFIKGNVKNLVGNNIGIVGCRECSDYGKRMAIYFGKTLSENNYNVVSGLARGIDGYSHYGNILAIQSNKNFGKPIAVLGNGLDIIYPKSNKKLYEMILKNDGTIISEFPCGVEPNKYNFPSRNRIISGLCYGIIFVEAKEKSGTLITAEFAIEQGRELFVVPGNIDSINSVGTNNLIKEGANVITSVEDIVNIKK